MSEGWFTENEDSEIGLRIGYAVEKVLARRKTEFQDLQVLQSPFFGRILTLDDRVMLTEYDEFIYHEMLVHVPIFAHPDPRRVLVVGGGDGGTLREAGRHGTVREMTLCEIDQGVIDASREFFPALAVGFDDPRSRIEVADAIEFVRSHEAAFDVVLIDSTDPIGPGVGLFTEEFYRSVHRALDEGGILAAQGESPYLHRDLVRSIHEKLRRVFPVTRLYQATIPTYPSGWWSFAYAAKEADPLADEVLARIESAALPTRYHTAEVHRAAFAIPPFAREIFEDES